MQTVTSRGIGFVFRLFTGGHFHNDAQRFLATLEHFPEYADDSSPGFFQAEQEADKCRDAGLPEQSTQTRIDICQNNCH